MMTTGARRALLGRQPGGVGVRLSRRRNQRTKILADTASAVAYLHSLPRVILHRDLKSLNVLLSEPIQYIGQEPEIRLCDFGFARVGRCGGGWSQLTAGAGTPHWRAPEVTLGQEYRETADTFSFAIIIYEVVCRHMAFENLGPEEASESIQNGERPGDECVPSDAPQPLLLLMVQCWAHSPEARPRFEYIHRVLCEIRSTILDNLSDDNSEAALSSVAPSHQQQQQKPEDSPSAPLQRRHSAPSHGHEEDASLGDSIRKRAIRGLHSLCSTRGGGDELSQESGDPAVTPAAATAAARGSAMFGSLCRRREPARRADAAAEAAVAAR